MSALLDNLRRLLGLFDPDSYQAPPGIPTPDAPRELVLYKSDTCPFCLRVYRVVDATGVEVTFRDVRGDPDARRTLQERTGRTTVPCLFVDDVPFFESADIAKWLYAHAARGHGAG